MNTDNIVNHFSILFCCCVMRIIMKSIYITKNPITAVK